MCVDFVKEQIIKSAEQFHSVDYQHTDVYKKFKQFFSEDRKNQESSAQASQSSTAEEVITCPLRCIPVWPLAFLSRQIALFHHNTPQLPILHTMTSSSSCILGLA